MNQSSNVQSSTMTNPINKGLILTLLCAAQFMVVLDNAIINVALPSIQRSLGFSLENLQWVVTAYGLTFGSLLLLGGKTADLYGRRRFFMIGLALFSFASLIGGFAQVQGVLIAARVIQGIGAAFVSPASLSLLTTIFAEGEDRNRALGVWGAVAAGGAAAGVLLGGVITDNLGWAWVLFVNVPIGAIVLFFSRSNLPESRMSGVRTSIDVIGAVVITAGLGLLVYALTQVERVGFGSPQTLVPLGVSVLALVGFVVIESRVTAPLIPLKIFRNRNVAGANIVVITISIAVSAVTYFLSIYMQQILGYSAILTGVAFLPSTLAIMVIANFAAPLIRRFGFKTLMLVGLSLMGVGLLLLTGLSTDGTYWLTVMPGLMVVSAGMGLAFVSATITATSGVADKLQGTASGLYNTSQQIGGGVGIALLTSVSIARASAFGTSNVAVVEGFRGAYLAGAVLVVIGVALGYLFIETNLVRFRSPAESATVPNIAPEPDGK